jgi:hypothetical protein
MAKRKKKPARGKSVGAKGKSARSSSTGGKKKPAGGKSARAGGKSARSSSRRSTSRSTRPKAATPRPAPRGGKKVAKAGRKARRPAGFWVAFPRPGDRAYPLHIHYKGKPGVRDVSMLSIGYGSNVQEAVRKAEEILDSYQRGEDARKLWEAITLSWWSGGKWDSTLT